MINRRAFVTTALAAMAFVVVGCETKSWSEIAKDQGKKEIPKVPYIVNPRSPAPDVVLWRKAERSAKKGIHHVPKGTKCKIIDNKELDRTRGGTMYKVKAVTGEVGWIPHFCIEFRRKWPFDRALRCSGQVRRAKATGAQPYGRALHVRRQRRLERDLIARRRVSQLQPRRVQGLAMQ